MHQCLPQPSPPPPTTMRKESPKVQKERKATDRNWRLFEKIWLIDMSLVEKSLSKPIKNLTHRSMILMKSLDDHIWPKNSLNLKVFFLFCYHSRGKVWRLFIDFVLRNQIWFCPCGIPIIGSLSAEYLLRLDQSSFPPLLWSPNVKVIGYLTPMRVRSGLRGDR